MMKYGFLIAVTAFFIQCASVQRTAKAPTLADQIIGAYSDSIKVSKMNEPTRNNFTLGLDLLLKKGLSDSLQNSILLKPQFSGYFITNNAKTVDQHGNIYCDIIEVKNDSSLLRVSYLFPAKVRDRILKMYSTETVVNELTLKKWLTMSDGPQQKYSPGIIVFKIDQGKITATNLLLNPPKNLIVDFYFGGIKGH